MSGFSAAWLALREPADRAARAGDVTALVAADLQSRSTAMCLDLGSGTGSNVRYLAERLPLHQEWRLLDDDADLLGRARAQLGSVRTEVADLRRLDARLFDGVDLVTASALLDLVSVEWLDTLVERVAERRAAVLFALNYDGRIHITPRDEDDDRIRDLVNRHQRTDKGFGPALGPAAGEVVEQRLRDAGYTMRVAPSDWSLGAGDGQLQGELLRGWASAAREMAPHERVRTDRWLERRLDLLSSGRSRIIVGHVDVAGVFPACHRQMIR
jgi:hypothetical protein